MTLNTKLIQECNELLALSNTIPYKTIYLAEVSNVYIPANNKTSMNILLTATTTQQRIT